MTGLTVGRTHLQPQVGAWYQDELCHTIGRLRGCWVLLPHTAGVCHQLLDDEGIDATD